MVVLAGLPGRSFERGKLYATKQNKPHNQNQTMKLFITFLSLAAAIWTPVSASASVGKATSASGLRRTQYSATPNTNEICFSSPKNYSQPELALLHSLASLVADDSFTGVTPPGQGVPHYALGCRFLDFKCYACDLCEDIYGTLVKTGSEVACDLACVGIAEAAGGGPEDRTYQRVARGNCLSFLRLPVLLTKGRFCSVFLQPLLIWLPLRASHFARPFSRPSVAGRPTPSAPKSSSYGSSL